MRRSLEAAARELDASVREDGAEGWIVAGGTWLSTHPNTVRWLVHVAPAGEGTWRLAGRPSRLPWTRRRMEFLTAFRSRQVADLVRRPRSLAPHERSPFSSSAGPPQVAFRISREVAAAALSMALLLTAVLLAAIPIVEGEIDRMQGRVEVFQRVGMIPLPTAGELSALRFADRLAAAFLLAAPVAFFLGAVHALVHGLGSRFEIVARFAPWSSAFLLGACTMAYWPRMNPLLAVVLAIMAPAAAQLGTGLVWGRGRDEVRDGRAPRRLSWAVKIGGAAAVLAILAVLIPFPRGTSERTDATSVFRDRYLLTNALGRAFGRFYYRYTLYAAEPLKPAYGKNPDAPDAAVYDRDQRTVLVIGKIDGEERHLKDMEFLIERVPDSQTAAPLIEKKQHDLYVLAQDVSRPVSWLQERGLLGRTICLQGPSQDRPAGLRVVPILSDDATWRRAVFDACRFSWLQGTLVELSWEGWTALFYAGPAFLLLLVIGAIAAPVGYLYARFSIAAGHAAIAGVFLLSAAGLAAFLASRSGEIARIVDIREERTDDLKTLEILEKGLQDADADVRYEAAHRAYQLLRRPSFPRGRLVDPLLRGVNDPEIRVRLWCAAALGWTRDERARPALHAVTRDPEIFVRYRAAEGLGALDQASWRTSRAAPPESIETLRAMMATGWWYEGLYALNALRKIEPGKH
ncbi:MAG: HEAT repeat domain-containing protein [Planctomycetes bacterium]|nr:HEAT repeat domain-containing protein [Planctomycetota bacterium]